MMQQHNANGYGTGSSGDGRGANACDIGYT